MATTVDTLLVRIEADMSDIKRDLDRLQKDTIKSTTAAGAAFKNLGRVVNVAAIGVISISLARAGKAAIDLAGDVAEMQSKSSVVFGQFRDQVVSDLSDFGASVGRSSHELEEMASSIQDTFVPMGFARGEAAKLSVDLTKLAVDVASFNNASDTDTMAAFQSALVGNHETVRRFGVVITEATLKQELLRMGIKRTGDEVTNSEKVQARLNLILDGTTDAQGDAARTADSYANQTKALGAEISTLALDIGRELLPMATDLVELFRDGVGVTRSFLQAIGVLSEFGRDAEGTAKQIQKLNNEIAFLEDPANNSFFINEQAKIDLKKQLLNTLEAELLAQQALASVKMDNTSPDGEDSGDDGSDFDLFTKKQRALAEELVLKRRQLELEKELKAARQSGNKEAIKQAEVNSAMFDIQKKNDALLAPMVERTLAIALASGNYASVTDTLSVSLAHANANLSLFDGTIKEVEVDITAMMMLTDEMNSALASFSAGVSQSFAETIMDGKDFKASMESMFADLVKTILAKAIELFVVNQIMNSIFGGVTGFSPLPSGQLFGAAGGGTIQPNTPTLVGERGPELFVPSGAGKIMNNMNTQNALGGGGVTVNQTINVETGVSQTVRAEMLSLLPVIKQDTLNAVADSSRRGGSFRQALA